MFAGHENNPGRGRVVRRASASSAHRMGVPPLAQRCVSVRKTSAYLHTQEAKDSVSSRSFPRPRQAAPLPMGRWLKVQAVNHVSRTGQTEGWDRLSPGLQTDVARISPKRPPYGGESPILGILNR